MISQRGESEGGYGISLVPLFSSVEWCNEALLLLQKLVDLEEKKETNPQYEYNDYKQAQSEAAAGV